MARERMSSDTIQLDGVYANGYGIIPRCVMEDTSIDFKAKAFYAYLCIFAGTSGSCYPSKDKIHHDLGIGRDAIASCTNQLVEAGYLRVEKIRENGRFCRNRYVLVCGLPTPCTAEPCTAEPCTAEPTTKNNITKNNSIRNNNYYNIPPYNPPRGDAPERIDGACEKKKTKKKSEFIPPTLGEVIAYCASRGNVGDAQKFYDYSSEMEWVDGKGQPVRNWKGKCITWERHDNGDAPTVNTRAPQTANAQVPVPPALSESELDELFGFEMPGKNKT